MTARNSNPAVEVKIERALLDTPARRHVVETRRGKTLFDGQPSAAAASSADGFLRRWRREDRLVS